MNCAKRFALLAATASALLANNLDADSFEVEVRGSGKPVILIPGLACKGEVWDDVVARYQKDYQCHTLSLAGFADTPPIENRNYLETVKEDLRAYIESQKLESSIVIGHSLGGFVGLWLASESNGLISRLVVVDSLPFFPAAMNPQATPETVEAQAAATRDAMQSASREQLQASQPTVLQSMITDPERIALATEWSVSSDLDTVAQAMYELNTIDLRHQLASVQVPTLVLGAWIAYKPYGSTRESTEAIFRSQYSALPDYRLEMTDHGKHFIMWDDPDFFFEKVDAFLRPTAANAN